MANICRRNIPYWTILSDAQIRTIHEKTLEVMEGVGVAVYDGEALALLKQAGAAVDGDTVRMGASLLERALASAPPSVMVYDRNGVEAMRLAEGHSFFGPGSDTTFTLDAATGQYRAADLETIKGFARLADALPNIDFTMSMGIAPETGAGNADRNHFLAMVENTRKPVAFTAQTPGAMAGIVEMCHAVSGSAQAFAAKPFAVLYAMPTAPLMHTREALQALMLAADAGLPCVYASGAMKGATGPVTNAGILVSSNAEMLTGLVIHQLRAPGAPFVYGATLGPLEMKTTVNIYCGPESMQMQVACLQLGRFYNLPTFATAGCSDSKRFDQQASAECALSLMTAALAGGNLIHDVGYLESGNCSSTEALVYADEMIGQMRYLLQGFAVDDEALATDVIRRVGIGGNYLADDHTLEHYRDAAWYPELTDHGNHGMWQAAGALDMGAKVRGKALSLLASHRPAPLAEEVSQKLKEIAAGR